MDESIFEDLEQLFEECDELTRSLNDTVLAKGDKIDLMSTTGDTLKAVGERQAISIDKSKVSYLNKIECKIPVTESNANTNKIGMPKSDANKTEREDDKPTSNVGKTKHETEVTALEDIKNKCKAYTESDKSELTVEISCKRLDGKESMKDDVIYSEESSREEGECSASFVGEKSLRCLEVEEVKKKKVELVMNYSSFIDTSKEEGECSTTSFDEDSELDITIKEAPPLKMTKVGKDTNKEKTKLLVFKPVKKEFEKKSNVHKSSKKRKRSISGCNESTPKRRHLFIRDGDDALSPIGFLPSTADKRRNILEMADTPLIESKFRFKETKLNFQEKDVCSSTPVSTLQKFSFPSIVDCSTPLPEVNSGKHNTLAKKKIIKIKETSDSDSDFQGLSDDGEITEKCQTVEELIAEITQLCEDCEKTLEGETSEEEQVEEKPNETVSKIHLDELMSEWKTRKYGEAGTDTEDGDITLIADVKDDSQTDKADSDDNKTEKDEDNVGRFKAEVTVSRLEEDKSNLTNKEVVDMDICDNDEHELQDADDLLNLDDYDDEGFVDAKDLEKSHLLNQTMKAKEIVGSNDSVKGKLSVEQPENLLKLMPNLKKEGKDDLDTGGKVEKDVNENVVRGLDYAAFDTSIYRKNENTAIEREICRRWRTHGSADPDINLTVASTKRNKCVEAGKKPVAGQLEGDHVVCTYLYEEENVSSFNHFGKTTGQSDLCYMTLENLLNKLYNQKEILENMNKQSLMNIKFELQLQLAGTQERHREEMEALKYRQGMEDDQFRFHTRNQFNPIEFQNRLMQLRQDHLFQQGRLKEHHENEFCAVRSRGLDILNQEVNRHTAQCEPIGQLIEQLEKPEANAISSPQKHGPPIVVSLRKGPCRASYGKHSTVPVCLSAGIAQAVSLEDDLYDHYYGY